MVRAQCRKTLLGVLFATVSAIVLFTASNAAAYTPEPLSILFVTNNAYAQEELVLGHLNGLGHEVSTVSELFFGRIRLSRYNLIVLSEYSPNLTKTNVASIKASGLPVFIIEHTKCGYSKAFGLTDTDSCYVTSDDSTEIVDLASRTAEYVGGEPAVYSSSGAIYGVAEYSLETGVVPISWDPNTGECSAFIDVESGYLSTGIYDTTKYTDMGWRLFDELMDTIAPMGPFWADIDDTMQGLVDSGLVHYIQNLTGNEPVSEVSNHIWAEIFTNNLHDVLPPVEGVITFDSPFGDIMLPPLHMSVPHPQYDYDDNSDLRWFLGEHRYADDGSYIVPVLGTLVDGVDLGISTRFNGRTYMYMGDTWGDGDQTDCESITTDAGVENAECDDAIVELASGDTDPTDGIDAKVMRRNSFSQEFLPTNIEGVHRDFGEDVWDVDGKKDPYSVPVGVSTKTVSTEYLFANSPIVLTYEQVRLWYATQATRDDYTTKTGKSWVGCSVNGKDFGNCYSYYLSGEKKYAYFSKDKFIIVHPVELTVSEVESMGANAPPHTSAGAGGTGGTLLFGVSHPYRCGSMYLAYVDNDDFGNVDTGTYAPSNVQYYTGDQMLLWSTYEANANPIYEPDCLDEYGDLTTQEQYDLWDDWYDIGAAVLEEAIWNGMSSFNLLPAYNFDFTDCDLSSQDDCDPNHCWLNSFYFTRDPSDTYKCDLCSDEEVSHCVYTIMNYQGAEGPYFSLGDFPWPTTDGFGEFSVRLAHFENNTSAFIMISNHRLLNWPERSDMVAAALNGVKNNPHTSPANGFAKDDFNWELGHVYFREAKLATPWDWNTPEDTGTLGYGPYIIDKYTTYSTTGSAGSEQYEADLWYTTSSWHGGPQGHDTGLPGAYGVYTTSSSHSVDLDY